MSLSADTAVAGVTDPHHPAAGPPRPAGGEPGFVDCRGRWHSWANEEGD